MQDDFETVPSPDSPTLYIHDAQKEGTTKDAVGIDTPTDAATASHEGAARAPYDADATTMLPGSGAVDQRSMQGSTQGATTRLGPGAQDVMGTTESGADEATTLLKADTAATALLDLTPSDEEDLEQSLAYQSLMKHRAERKKKRIVKIAIASVLAIVAIVAVVIASSQSADDTGTDLATASVTREDFVDSVTVNGAAQPVSSVIVNPEVDGTIDQVLVKEGDTVEAGQTLFTLKNDDLDKAVREANQQVKEAKNGVSSAQASVDSAKTDLKTAKAKLADAQNAQANPPAPINAGDQGSADGQTTDSGTTAAELAAAVTDAQAGVDSASDAVVTAEVGLESAQLTLESAQAAYDEAVKATEKRTVVAPSAGAVVVMNAVPGAAVAAGTTAASGTTSGSTSSDGLIQIADLSQMRVSVQVNEADISKIQVGQKATVTFSALPDVTCEGEVQSIATVATGSGSDSTDSSGSATYAVDLLIAQPDPRIKPGMTASVEIVAQEVKDALTVPATAVTTDDAGNATVTVVTYADDGSYTTEDVPVQVIAQSSTTAAITGDIHEDDLVLLGGTTTDDGSDATDADATADETVTYG